MARTTGARSTGYGERRAALLAGFRARLVEPNLPPPSLRELAAAAGVTIPTVRHYFGRREDVVVALIEDLGREGAVHLAETAAARLPFAESIAAAIGYIAMGFRFGVSEIHVLGLREGLRHDRIGPAYLTAIFEPSLAAIEARLTAHQARGEMRPGDVRHAAIALLSPLVIAALHQGELGGAGVRALDLDAFLADHATAFVRAHSVSNDAVAADRPSFPSRSSREK